MKKKTAERGKLIHCALSSHTSSTGAPCDLLSTKNYFPILFHRYTYLLQSFSWGILLLGHFVGFRFSHRKSLFHIVAAWEEEILEPQKDQENESWCVKKSMAESTTRRLLLPGSASFLAMFQDELVQIDPLMIGLDILAISQSQRDTHFLRAFLAHYSVLFGLFSAHGKMLQHCCVMFRCSGKGPAN